MSRRRVAVGAVVLGVAVAATVSFLVTSDPEGAATTAREPDPSAIAPPDTDEPHLRMEADAVVVQVPGETLVSRFDPAEDRYEAPRRSASASLRLTGDDSSSGGHVALLRPDADQRVEDVLVFSNSTTDGQMADIQWLMSSRGVELAWTSDGKSDWTVERDGEVLTSRAAGRYVDARPTVGGVRYQVRRADPVEFEHQGRTIESEEATTYVALVPDYDDSLIGRPVPTTPEPATPGVRPQARTSSTAQTAPLERALFVEWNSFIPEPFIPAPDICAQNVFTGFDLFKGDGRDFIGLPASDEGFTSRGTPRSRMSTRVGAAWSLTDPSADLNRARFDSWLYRGVGTTSAHQESEMLLTAANTGRQGFTLKESRSDAERAWRLVKGSEDDPLCSLPVPNPITGTKTREAPTIDYEYSLDATRSGNSVLSAIFDKAPNTEILWETSTDTSDPGASTGGCAFRYENRGFSFLAAAAPSERIQITVPRDASLGDCPVQ